MTTAPPTASTAPGLGTAGTATPNPPGAPEAGLTTDAKGFSGSKAVSDLRLLEKDLKIPKGSFGVVPWVPGLVVPANGSMGPRFGAG